MAQFDGGKIAGAAVLAIAAYESGIEFVNAKLGEDFIPSILEGAEDVTVRTIVKGAVRKLFPEEVVAGGLFALAAGIEVARRLRSS